MERTYVMKLYYSPGACSLAPHIVLREAGLAFDLAEVIFPAKTVANGMNFLEINPKGLVPVLQLDDGEVLTEAAVILQYVADIAPEKALIPAAGTKARYHVQEWLNYIATEVHKAFGPLWKPETPREYKPIVKANLAKQFAYLDQRLTGQAYLTGESFTVADAYLFTILNWTTYHQIDLAPYRNVTAFIARTAARPKVQDALRAEGLAKAA
jgi:glutathione S-transferase